jgi:hypothetical protein
MNSAILKKMERSDTITLGILDHFLILAHLLLGALFIGLKLYRRVLNAFLR